MGHRGRKSDPPTGRDVSSPQHRSGSATAARSDSGASPDAGDPHGEVRTASHATETVRGIYDIDSPVLGLQYTLQLADDLQDQSCPPEINQLGRTISRWCAQITNWHITRGDQQMPPKLSTTSSNASSGQRSGYPTSRTTEYVPSSTPGSPTGTYSPRSLPTEIHS